MSNEVVYNGYRFNDYSHISVSAQLIEDDAQRTVAYHKYRLRVETTIYGENAEQNAGAHFLRIRQRLTKPGQSLTIGHDGFGPRLVVNGGYGVSDVAFGPKPRIVTWEPIGNTLTVHCVWECEFNIPTCNADGRVRFDGLMSLNYGISVRINKMGYTTRTISGYLEIAMTRMPGTRQIPDTADAYRDRIIVARPVNFERETSWQLSPDKRRADFSITDSEIESPNAYPAGVVAIRANHRVGWNRRQLATLPNTISASITLSPTQPRMRAWEIFRNMVALRILAAQTAGDTVFIESLDANEEIYENTLSFACTYRLYVKPESSALQRIFTSTGFAQPLPDNWQSWAASVANLQNNYGLANLVHLPSQDQLIDLCTEGFLPQTPVGYNPNGPAPSGAYNPFCNEKPSPENSYLQWETWLNVDEDNPATPQVSMGRDDFSGSSYTPFDPNATIDASAESFGPIKRYVESVAPNIEMVWTGYAVRVGYPIPRPARLTIDGVTLTRKGKGEFRQRFLGRYFCQRVYAASWRHRYVVDERPGSIPESELNSTQEFGGGT